MGREARETKRSEGRGRSRRVPLGQPRMKLKVPEHLIPKNKKGYWFNDTPGRLEEAEEAGYGYVADPNAKVGEGAENERDRTSTKVRKRVGTTKDGAPVMAYLMVIDKDLAEEDKKAKEAERKEQVDVMRRGVHGAEEGHDTSGRYLPDGGVQIEQN